MFRKLHSAVNDLFREQDTGTVVLAGSGLMVAGHLALYAYENWAELKLRAVRAIYGAVQAGAGDAATAERDKVVAELAGSLQMEDPEGVRSFTKLPSKGLTADEVRQQCTLLAKRDEANWKEGQVSGCVYFGEREHGQLLNDVAGMFALTNPLHPDVFPSTRKFEAEVVAMTLDMMNGDASLGHCGTMTSGGTESILLAMRAYKERGEAAGIRKGCCEIIAPRTSHAAFHKAASYFGMKLVLIDTDPKTHAANLKAMERAITSRTVCLVGSAPEFPHGIVDPIGELGALAIKYKIGLHVDCCLGGFLLPFARRLPEYRESIPPFDFSVPGVSSISADTHKYGYTIKGTSVLLFNDRELRRHMYYCFATWPGGTYATPLMSGSRCGMVVAACWASLVTLGDDGMLRMAAAIMRTARAIKEGLRSIEGVQTVGDPQVMVIALASDTFDVRRLGTALGKRGWNLNQLQNPPSLHFTVSAANIGVEERFLKDVRELAAEIIADDECYTGGSTAVYGMADRLPDTLKDVLIGDLAFSYMDALLEPPTNPTQ